MNEKTIEQKLLEKGYKAEWQRLEYNRLYALFYAIEDKKRKLPEGKKGIEAIAILSTSIALNDNSINPDLHNVYILYK